MKRVCGNGIMAMVALWQWHYGDGKQTSADNILHFSVELEIIKNISFKHFSY